MTNFQIENGYDPQEMKELLLRQNGLSVSDGESVTDAFETLKKELAVLRQDNLTLTGQVSQLAELLSRTVDRLRMLEKTADIVNDTILNMIAKDDNLDRRLSKLEQEQPDGK